MTSNKRYEITLTRNLVSDTFLTKDQKVLDKVKKCLSQLCIQTDFHSKYKTIAKIGEGTFGSVYKVHEFLNKENEFAVKQFDKDA